MAWASASSRQHAGAGEEGRILSSKPATMPVASLLGYTALAVENKASLIPSDWTAPTWTGSSTSDVPIVADRRYHCRPRDTGQARECRERAPLPTARVHSGPGAEKRAALGEPVRVIGLGPLRAVRLREAEAPFGPNEAFLPVEDRQVAGHHILAALGPSDHPRARHPADEGRVALVGHKPEQWECPSRDPLARPQAASDHDSASSR